MAKIYNFDVITNERNACEIFTKVRFFLQESNKITFIIAMNIWNLKLMEQEIGPYEFYSECFFYTFN